MVRMDQPLLWGRGRRATGGEIYFPLTLEIFMKRFATLFVALGLATAGSTVIADQAKDQLNKQKAKPQPVQMTDAQMDNVTGGLVNVVVIDAVDVNRNDVQVQVSAAAQAAVAILGAAGGAAGSFPRQVLGTNRP